LNFTNRNAVEYKHAPYSVWVNLAVGRSAGGAGEDVLINIDQINGSYFNDTLIGSDRSEIYEVFYGWGGDDSIDGAGGWDMVGYWDATAGITATLSAGSGSVLGSGAGMGVDTLTNIEGIWGTNFDDVITGGASSVGIYANRFWNGQSFGGEGGNDTIDGGEGFDKVSYGSALQAVVVNLATGVATDGLGGVDRLINIEGVMGSNFDDALIGSAGDEVFTGTKGKDSIDGGGGIDTVDYYASMSGVVVNLASGTVTNDGDGGSDTLLNIENVFGTRDFNDSITGNSGNNLLEGNGGNDNLSGNGGDDTLLGGDGDDRLLGGAGNDSMDGGADGMYFHYGDTVDYAGSTTGVDVNLTTGLATDGLGGTDTLLNIEHISGSAFADRLVGNSRNNLFMPGAGNDTVDGVASSASSPNVVMYGDASAGVVINLATGVADGTSIGHDTLANIWAAHGSDFNDQITLSDNGGYTFGQAGNDLINGGSQGEYLNGGTGNDTINGGGGSDTAAYDLGTTRVDGLSLVGTASTGWTLSRSGVNLVGFSANTATGKWTVTDLRTAAPSNGPLSGVDVLSAVEQVSLTGVDGNGASLTVNLSLEGTLANPLLGLRSQVGSSGNDLLSGTSGNDTLSGLAGNDTLMGYLGNDILRGGAGDDILNGGEQRYLGWKNGQIFATSDYDTADYSDVTTGGIRLDLSTMKVTSVNGADVGTDTLRGIEEVRGTNQSDTVVGSFAAISGNNEAAGDQHSLDLTLFGGSDTVTLSKVQSMPWLDGAYMGYWWSKTGVNAVFAGSVGTISYTASLTQAAGVDTTDGVSSFGDSPYADRFDFSGMTSNFQVGARWNYVNLNEGGNDTIVGNGDTQVNFSSNTLLSTTGLGVNVRLAAPGTSFTVDMTHLSRSASWSFGTVTLSNIEAIRGTNLNDTLVGGAYDDFEAFRGKGGDDLIDGGTGGDRADYFGATAGVTVNLAAGTASGDSSVGNDTLRSIETIRGTALDDVYDARGFSSTSVNAGSLGDYNGFEGRGGNDTIYGNGRTRIEYQNSGVAVEVNLASGKAWAFNPADRTGDLNQYLGTDTFTGVYGVRGSALGDLLLGGGVGWMHGDTAIESFDPDAGNDTVNGFGGWDSVGYGSSTAAITVDLRLATGQVQDGMGGVDTLIGIEWVGGSDFNDSMVGSDTNIGFGNQEAFRGGKGNDTLNGGGGYDEAEYTDEPTNGIVVNLATGVAQDGWGGTDTLSNIEGVEGSWKNDSITGSSADNRLDGRGGNDTLDGGAGSDTAEYNQAPGAVQVNLALGTATGADGNDMLISIENVYGSIYGDTLTGNAGANTLEGLAGNDTLSGEAGNDTLLGGDGQDLMEGGLGNDTIDGGTITDTLNMTDSNTVSYQGASGAVAVNLSLAQPLATGADGTDVLLNINIVNASGFDDTITGSARTDVFERFRGGAGNDSIDGGGGSFDFADFSDATGGVTVTLTGNGNGTATGAGIGTDTLKSIQGIIGSNFADVLTGSASTGNAVAWVEVFRGEAGNDTIDGGAGFDFVLYDTSTSGVVVT
jgi:Ca2+-binding RTX toxin-like protein